MRKPYLKQSCVMTKGGFRTWVEESQAVRLSALLDLPNGSRPDFVEVEDGLKIAVSEIVGVFPPESIEDEDERRRGSWRCPRTGRWHGKENECHCLTEVVLPDLGRTVSGPAGIMLTPEEHGAVMTFADPEAAAVSIRKGRSEWDEWNELMRSRSETTKRLTKNAA